jgi:hypothetical protein
VFFAKKNSNRLYAVYVVDICRLFKVYLCAYLRRFGLHGLLYCHPLAIQQIGYARAPQHYLPLPLPLLPFPIKQPCKRTYCELNSKAVSVRADSGVAPRCSAFLSPDSESQAAHLARSCISTCRGYLPLLRASGPRD